MADAVRIFKALGDETRLRILNLLSRGELCVCDIMKVLDVPQSRASRHLAHLRATGLVTDRREGRWMYYTLAPTGRELQRWLSGLDNEVPRALADLQALESLRRSGELCSQCPPASPGAGDGVTRLLPSVTTGTGVSPCGR
jgi:ArsR family transcriptional regulator